MQIWQLGQHRLLCGDSTKAGEIDALMEWEHPELVITDPPYAQELKGGTGNEIGKRLSRKGGELATIETSPEFDPSAFLQVLSGLFPAKTVNSYIFCNKDLLPDYLNYAVAQKWAFNVLVWHKPNPVPIKGSHRPDLEYIVQYRKRAVFNNNVPGLNYSRCLEYGKVMKSEENGWHPTVKPLALIKNEILISSTEGGIVVDLFGGSGTTLLACEQTGRRCFMAEINPSYCSVIIRRWEAMSGKKAVEL